MNTTIIYEKYVFINAFNQNGPGNVIHWFSSLPLNFEIASFADSSPSNRAKAYPDFIHTFVSSSTFSSDEL